MPFESWWDTTPNPEYKELRASISSKAFPSSPVGITEEGLDFPDADEQWLPAWDWTSLPPSVEFLCTEHTRNVPSSSPQKVRSIAWTPQNIWCSLYLEAPVEAQIPGRCDLQHRKGSMHLRRSPTLTGELWVCKVPPKSKFSSAPVLPAILSCSNKWNLASQIGVLNFLPRTQLNNWYTIKVDT